MGLEDLTRMKAEYEARMRSEGEKAIKDHLNTFFAKHPEVKALRWEQYTPYFNDGDSCTFSMNDISVKLKSENVGNVSDEKSTSDDDEDYDNDSFIDTWKLKKENDALAAAVTELYRELSNVEDILQAVLGDHSRITVTADKVDIEEYDHE